jgi:hypothetical protein
VRRGEEKGKTIRTVGERREEGRSGKGLKGAFQSKKEREKE